MKQTQPQPQQQQKKHARQYLRAVFLVLVFIFGLLFGDTISSIEESRRNASSTTEVALAVRSGNNDIVLNQQGPVNEGSTPSATVTGTTATTTGTNTVPNSNTDIGKIIKKSSGFNWTLWDQKAPIKPDIIQDAQCHWTTFRSSTGKEAKMCTHDPTQDRLVSRSIVQQGRWKDCDALTQELLQQQDDTSTSTNPLLFIDIGSNIGSCTLEVLLSTNAHVIAFEPHPRNQFCLTSTLMELPLEMRQRVTYFPIALGKESGPSTIHAADGNFGNSVVGKEIKDFAKQQFQQPIPIVMERLDDVLDTQQQQQHDYNIGLMKLDAQGLECQIVEGMPQVLTSKVLKIHTELAGKWLRGHGCSPPIYLNQLRAAQFDVYLNNKGGSKTILVPGDNVPGGILTVTALKKKQQQ